MKYFILLCICLFIGSLASAQEKSTEYLVSFEDRVADIDTKYMSQLMLNPHKVNDETLHELKGIPQQTDIFAVYLLAVNPAQEIYNNLLKNKITHERYTQLIKEQELEAIPVTDNFIGKNKFYMYVGLDKIKGEKYVVVDCNNNLDFSDDKFYTYSLSDYKSDFKKQDSLCPIIQIEASSYNGTECLPTLVNVVLKPFYTYRSKADYATEDEFFLNIVLVTNYYKQGTVKINNKHFIINENSFFSSNLYPVDLNSKSDFRFYQEGDSVMPNSRRMGDTIRLADKSIFIEKAIGNTLYLRDVGVSVDSTKIGDMLPALYSKSLSGYEKLHLNEMMKGKYVFIDFWGSWCAPCIASIPKIAELYDKVKNRDDVMILGIALDHEKDIEKLKGIIKDKNVNWLNVWNSYSDRNVFSSPHSKLDVQSFPTYLIVDKSGKIIYRSMKGRSRNLAFDFFLELIDE